MLSLKQRGIFQRDLILSILTSFLLFCFQNNTISLDLAPYYRNGVDEEVFNNLHCNDDDQPHDPRELW